LQESVFNMKKNSCVSRGKNDPVRSVTKDNLPGFEEIMRTYQDRIFNLCVYMLRDRQDAQDAAQETFIKVFRNLHGFEPNSSLYTWIYRIGINTCLDQRRKRKPRSLESDLPFEEVCSRMGVENPYESVEASELLRWSLQNLPEKLRTVIVLKEMEGLSYEEIAGVLEISLGTVKSRLSRARDELRRLLRKK